MSGSIQVLNVDLVLGSIVNVNEALIKRIDKNIQIAGIGCQAYAKQFCPVDTGRLRASIQYQSGYLTCYVTTNVFYAWYIEFGTVKMRAYPFMVPAFIQAGQDLQSRQVTI
jgi:HK97 gp10 family phage protein